VPDPDRWAIVERIYHQAVDRPVGERPAFLDTACAGDVGLRNELESLLAHDGLSLLDESALDIAARSIVEQEPARVGQTIRHFEILALLGTGGMGEVYRARDRSLGREVAIKFLPESLSQDPERLRRLQLEARILAALNHPNIATLYGLEAHDDRPFLVMELVPGRTLAEHLERGALPIDEAIEVCRQIAAALEAAHGAGIVHRDLKPANVKIAPDGRVKLLDFGVAKAFDSSIISDESATKSRSATVEGTLMGTPGYMSPEQARGKTVDQRTDIWAFGCCAFECFTGRCAFPGNTVTDTLAAVLNSDPDWTALGDEVAPAIRRLLRRSLAKDARQRLQHIGDARLELEEVRAGTNEQPRVVRSRPARTWLLGGLALIAIVMGLAVWLQARRTISTGDTTVTSLTLKVEGDPGDRLRLPISSFYTPFALSPDGKRLVFRASGNGGSRLYLRELSGFETRPLPGTEGATTPFFSPDGRWIGFWRAEDRILRKVSVTGGSPIEIAPTDVPYPTLWTSNDEILIQNHSSSDGQLLSVSANGGSPSVIALRDRSKGESIEVRATVPGGKDLLVASSGIDGSWLEVLSRDSGKRRRLLRCSNNGVARFTDTGHLVYSEGDALLVLPVNERLEAVGEPTPVLRGIDRWFLHSHVVMSDNGTVVYLPQDRVHESELVWIDRQGNASPVTGGRAPLMSATLSPSGREAAGEIVDGTKVQVWIFDLERGTRRLLVSEGDSRQPIWSRDGKFVTYGLDAGDKLEIFRKRADGVGPAELLIDRPSSILEDWSPDGRSLLFSQWTNRGDTDIWAYSDGKAKALVSTPFREDSPRFSPDGRFIAFNADDGGVSHVYLQPFPGPGPRTPVSPEEAEAPTWIDGRHLLFGSGGRRMIVEVQTDPVVRVGQPLPLDDPRVPSNLKLPSADGRHFLSLSPRRLDGPIELRVILNSFQEFERLAPHPRR
jgi:eukaryotic-like serine/threonine-protein kinase